MIVRSIHIFLAIGMVTGVLIYGQGCGPAFKAVPVSLDELGLGSVGDERTKVCENAPDVGRVVSHRLNNSEYDNTIRDLLGVSRRPSVQYTFPADEFSLNFNNNARVLSITPGLLNKYLESAEGMLDEAFANSTLRSRLIPCTLSQSSCVETVFHSFLLRAFRRPPTSGEVASYVNLTRLAQAEGDPIETGVKVAMAGALISPHFLYRIPQHPQPNNDKMAIDISPYELAVRVSYFVWSSMPDDALLEAARTGQLASTDGLETQVRRMLKDPKAASLLDNFVTQWMQLNHLDAMQPDPTTFPTYSIELREDLRTETRLLLKDLIDRDGSFYELLTADYSYLNERLAGHYGIAGVSGTQFRKVNLAGSDRLGVLTHGSLLTINANPDRTSIVKRGKWVLENLLCTPPPPPPPEVVGDLPPADSNLSMRERLERHRANPACFSCHAQMDPIGFALESFDGIGRFRTMDKGTPIDDRGEFPDGRTFTGARELASVVRDDHRFRLCVAEKMFTFALGREPEAYDRCTINRIGMQHVAPDKSISSAVVEMIKSDPFRKVRGEGAAP